jgi:hypothetical protein
MRSDPVVSRVPPPSRGAGPATAERAAPPSSKSSRLGDSKMAIDFEAEFGVNAGYVEALFEKWRGDQGSVDAEWREWFESLAGPNGRDATPASTD